MDKPIDAMTDAANDAGAAARRLRAALSALADGATPEDPQDWPRLREAWTRDPALRREWQLLQLAGEALRAPALAPPVQSAEALLSGLRARLGAEPVPIARARARRRLRELWPALAVAAGFVLVALLVPGGLRVAPGGAASPLDVAQADTLALPPVDGAALLPAADMLAEPSFAAALTPAASGAPAEEPPQLRAWPRDTLALPAAKPRPAQASAPDF
ncbi:MAG: hypothetical protein JO224_02385 [Pelomonas sp.]|nr:hypothetical protein [Roseateles sp.]